MPTPQFDVDVDFFGFDRDAVPRWLTVGPNESKAVSLSFAKWSIVKSDNANITITEVTPKDTWASFLTKKRGLPNFLTPEARQFFITGVRPGFSKISVTDPDQGNAFVLRLEVEVKDRRRHPIAYHFVDQTTYDQIAVTTEVHSGLNMIFELQANVTFDIIRAQPLISAASLRQIVFDLKHEERRNPTHREWERLVDGGDPTAEFNVFFMPWDGRQEERPTEMLVRFDGARKNIICPDGMALGEVERALSHELGRFLGCDVTQIKKQEGQLMFRASSDDGDLGKFVRSGDYQKFNSRRLSRSRLIPKDCANTLNPTFGP